MDVIRNEYDGPKKPTKLQKAQGIISLDFAYSENAKVVDAGIKEAIRGVKVSIMAMGIALYRMDVSEFYYDLGYKKFGEYIDHLSEETGMARTTLYNWEYVGDAYITHRSELDSIGFSNDDGPTKLPFLPRALENYSKREVFKNIKLMNKREFEDWSKGPLLEKHKTYKNIMIKGNEVFVGKSPLVSFAEDISPKDRKYYEGLLLEGAVAVQKNEFARCYRFYDEAEARRFDKVYQKELKILRAKK